MLRHARRVAATRGLRRSLHLALYKIDDETVCLKLSHEQLRGKTTEELEALYAPKRERFDLAVAESSQVVEAGVYEGGRELWECAIDLVEWLAAHR